MNIKKETVFWDRAGNPPLQQRLITSANTLGSIFFNNAHQPYEGDVPPHTELETQKFGPHTFNIYHSPAKNPRRVVYLLGGFGDTFLGNQPLSETLNAFNISLIYGQLPEFENKIGFMPLLQDIAESFFRKKTRFSPAYQDIKSDLMGYSVGGQCLLNVIAPRQNAPKIEDDNRPYKMTYHDLFDNFDGLIAPLAPFLSTKDRMIPKALEDSLYRYAFKHPNTRLGESPLEKVITAYFQFKGLEVFGPKTVYPTWAQAVYLRKEAQSMYERLKKSDIPDDLYGHPRLLVVQGSNDSVSDPSLTIKIGQKLGIRRIIVKGAFHYLFTPARTQNLLSLIYQGECDIPPTQPPVPALSDQRKPFGFGGKPRLKLP